jgi:ribA/ribD-fused uncharacterized protein
MINRFIGKYAGFSNFVPAVVSFEGITFPTVEHAYVAAKTLNIAFRRDVAMTPAKQAGVVKKWGRTVVLRGDWEDIKVAIMQDLLLQKFQQQPFKDLLMGTKDQKIVEGNYWHDNFWGDCFCKKCTDIKGEDMLGHQLMTLREYFSLLDENITNLEITS